MKFSNNSNYALILALIILFSVTFIIHAAPNNIPQTVDNTFIITAESTDLPPELTLKMNSLGAHFISILDGLGVAIVASDNPEFQAEIVQIAGISSVVPDIQIRWLDSTANAQQNQYTAPPLFSNNNNFLFDVQWGLAAINATGAWNSGYRGSGALVAVLDTGFDLTHPDLQPNIDFNTSASFVPGEDLQFAGSGFCHGCHIAGIIAAADNDVGIIGVAPEAKLMLLKVLNDTGSGSFSWTLNAIIYAANNGANIINMSFGIFIASNDSYLDTINRVTKYAYSKGVTIIAAAGNDASNRSADSSVILVPAAAAHVLTISAIAPIGWGQYPLRTNFDNIASYSDYGVSYIDFTAPGGDIRYTGTGQSTLAYVTANTSLFDMIVSATSNGVWAWANGTSMAAPHVSGVAALVVGKNGGFLDPESLECVLAGSADGINVLGGDEFIGKGRVNAYKAVRYEIDK